LRLELLARLPLLRERLLLRLLRRLERAIILKCVVLLPALLVL
jgi:hypothetical protein